MVLFALLAPFCLADSLTFYESFDNQQSIQDNGCISCLVSSFAEGIIGNAAYFGSGSSLTYPILDNLDKNGGTVSFWVKPNDLDTAGGFFDYGGLGTAPSFGIFKPSWNELHFETRTDEDTQRNQHKSNAFKEDSWTNVVIVWKTNSASSLTGLYVDGNLVLLWTYTSFNFNPSEDFFMVGKTGWYGVANAYLDELKIYDYVRSAAEIKQDYNEVINYTPPHVPPVKPESKGPIKINSSGLFVNNESFFIKGVGYQPTPICENYGYDFFSHPEIYNRDFPLLREMNANTIRTWATVTNPNFLDAAYSNGVNPIYVIMSYYIGTTGEDYSDPARREILKQGFRNYVSQFKDHPAVLMWIIGNENNLHYTGDMSYWYSLVNEMAQIAYEIEGESYHPVSGVNGDIYYIGDGNYKADDASLNYTDFWAINAYRDSFVTFFDEYSALSSKPLLLSEFGIDALDNRNGQEYEQTQAEWDLSMWNDIVNSDITIGATVMEYCDEWQKDWTTNEPCVHTKNCAYTTPYHPDGCSNEEWWGVMRTVDNGGNPDIMQPRQVYYALQNAWLEKEEFNINLNEGWNLISIPLILLDNSVSSVFSGISYSKLFYYNNGWKVPTEINTSFGYWIKTDSAGTLTVEGLEQDAQINPDTGWNLIGYPSLNQTDISEFFDDATVYMYNNSEWYSYDSDKHLNTLAKFTPGFGYWLKIS